MFAGETCRANGDVIYIGTTANIATLAHEFGHAFGLKPMEDGGHVNFPDGTLLPGFGTNNIMVGGGLPTRDSFTIGQSFRMNVDRGSRLNADRGLDPPIRRGPSRPCAPLAVSRTCPELRLDSLPH